MADSRTLVAPAHGVRDIGDRRAVLHMARVSVMSVVRMAMRMVLVLVMMVAVSMSVSVVGMMGIMVRMVRSCLSDELSIGKGGRVAIADALAMARRMREGTRVRRSWRRCDGGHDSPAKAFRARRSACSVGERMVSGGAVGSRRRQSGTRSVLSQGEAAVVRAAYQRRRDRRLHVGGCACASR